MSETFPTLTHWLWDARDKGAKLIVVDPRLTPIARTADLHLPIRPGRDSALYGAILHQLIKHDWLDHEFIDNYTSGFDETAAAVKDYDLDWAERVTGISKEKSCAPPSGGASEDQLPDARARHRAPFQGSRERERLHQSGARDRPHRQAVLRLRHDHRPRQCQGGREHGHKCDQLPGNRDIENPEHRRYISEVWGIDEKELPGKGSPHTNSCRQFTGARSKGSSRFASTRSLLPNNNMIREALEKLEFYCAIDFSQRNRALRGHRLRRLAA